MALIKCPECEKEISDKVKACPHCGFPLVEESTTDDIQKVEVSSVKLKKMNPKKKKVWIVIMALVVLLVAYFGYSVYVNSLNPFENVSIGSDIEHTISALGEPSSKSKSIYTVESEYHYKNVHFAGIKGEFNVKFDFIDQELKVQQMIFLCNNTKSNIKTIEKHLNENYGESTKAFSNYGKFHSIKKWKLSNYRNYLMCISNENIIVSID